MYNCTAECDLSILSHLVHSGWKRERDESRRGKYQHQFASISSNKSAVHPQTCPVPVTVQLHVCLSHLCHQPDSGCSPQGWSTRIWTQLLLTLAAASRTSSPTHRHWRALQGRKREERRGSNGGRRGIEGGSKGDGLEKEKRGEREGREVQGEKERSSMRERYKGREKRRVRAVEWKRGMKNEEGEGKRDMQIVKQQFAKRKKASEKWSRCGEYKRANRQGAKRENKYTVIHIIAQYRLRPHDTLIT